MIHVTRIPSWKPHCIGTLKLSSSVATCETFECTTGPDDLRGTLLVIGCDDGRIIIFNKTIHKIIYTLEGHNDGILCLAVYAPVGVDGALVEPLVISGSRDKTCKIWSLRSGQCVHTLEGHNDEITCLAVYAPVGVDGAVIEPLVISGSRDKTCKIWSLCSFELLYSQSFRSKCVCMGLFESLYADCIVSILSGGDTMTSVDIPSDIFQESFPASDLIDLNIQYDIETKNFDQTMSLLRVFKQSAVFRCPNVFSQGVNCMQQIGSFKEELSDIFSDFIHLIHDENGQSALKIAIDSESVTFIRFVINCWLNCLMKHKCLQNMDNNPLYFLRYSIISFPLGYNELN